MKMTQERFAEIVGVHEQTVARWERGEMEAGHWYIALMNRISPAVDDDVFMESVRKQKKPLEALRMLLHRTRGRELQKGRKKDDR
jgi:DNA-binding XRE family transcriptional regulator